MCERNPFVVTLAHFSPVQRRIFRLACGHNNYLESQVFGGHQTAAYGRHDYSQRPIVGFRRHCFSRQVFTQDFGQLLAGFGKQRWHQMLLPVRYVAHGTVCSHGRKQIPMHISYVGDQLLPDRQGDLAC